MSEEDKNYNAPEGDVDAQDGDQSEQEQEDNTSFFNFDEETEEKEGEPEEVEKKPEDKKEGEYVSREEHESFKRDQKVSDFLNDPKNADYKDFGGKIRELAKHPASKGITVDALARMAVPTDYWIKKGAEMGSQADTESRQTYTSGAAARDEVKGKGSQELGDPYDIKDPGEFLAAAMNMARQD